MNGCCVHRFTSGVWVLNNPISLHFEEKVGKVARYLEVKKIFVGKFYGAV